MKILISGGSGFIGFNLTKSLLKKNHEIVWLSRKNGIDKILGVKKISQLNGDEIFDVIINLAGKPLNEARWNKKIKQEIYDSRILTTRKIVDFINNSKTPPKLLISGSAIGYYGDCKDKEVTENSKINADDFAAHLCKDWENEASKAKINRLCLIRTGVVLGKKNGKINGALKEMIIPFKFAAGAVLGSGKQYFSWIHIDDEIAAIEFLIENENLSGAFNLTAPNALTNQEFSIALAHQVKRPLFLRMPEFVVRILFGEMADNLLLKGQKVAPQKLLQNGFKFKFGDIDNCLKNICR